MTAGKETIVYIGGFELPDKNAAANRVRNNAKVFAKLGFNVAFIGVDSAIVKNSRKCSFVDSFESWRIKYPRTTFEWIKEQLSFDYIAGILNMYDNLRYVVAYNMHAVPLMRLIKWCRKRNIIVIVDSTEWYGNRFSFSPGRFVRWIDTNISMRYVQKKADGLIAISEFLADYYRRTIKNVIVVPPLVDICDPVWLQDVDTNSEYIDFVYTGRAGNGKKIIKDKIDLVIEAIGKIENREKIRFTIVGMTKQECVRMFPNIIGELDSLEQNLFFMGKITHKQSIYSLLVADYCIFIRDKNRANTAGFPTKFVECMTTGVGIIMNNTSDVSKYFPHKRGFLLAQYDVDSIKDAIESAVSLGKIKHSMDTTFDYNNYVEEFGDFFAKF